jgi:two-component system NarL family sensor kinase
VIFRIFNTILIFTLILSCDQIWSQRILKENDTDEVLKNNLQNARIEKDYAEIAKSYFKLGEFYQYRKNDLEKAFQNYLIARQYFVRVSDFDYIKYIDEFVADRNISLGFFEEGLNLYEELISYYSAKGDSASVAVMYHKCSKAAKQRGDIEAQIGYQNKLSAYKSNAGTSLILSMMIDKIENYIQLKERDSALITAIETAKIASRTDNNQVLSKVFYFIGILNFKANDKDKTLKYLEKSLEIMPATLYNQDKKDLYFGMAQAYEKFGEKEKALKYYKEYSLLNDSILNHARLSVINEMAQKFNLMENKKKVSDIAFEKESALIKNTRQSRLLYFVSAWVLLLLLFIYFIIRFYVQKINTEKIINEQQHQIDVQKIQDLENKIKINSMQSMILGEEKERERIAKDLHDSLGGLLSTVKLQFDNVKAKMNGSINTTQYDKATQLLDTAVNEVRTISKNLQPAALKRYGLVASINDLISRFRGENMPEIFFQHYELPEQIDELVAVSIYRVIQELLNNSIKYANAKEILIQLNGEPDAISIQYEDDGNGFDLATIPKKGMGMENINSRINYLKGSISIDSVPNEGISVLARVPVKLE